MLDETLWISLGKTGYMIEEKEETGAVRATSSTNASSSSAHISGEEVPVPDINHDDDHLMCRVCRGNDGHLFYPCRCTGSIKYVHQECLTEWLKYSKKEVCELCNYKYSFQAIYRADMPKALPIRDIVRGLAVSSGRMIKTWLLYSIVLLAWLGLVPLTACRIYNIVFYTSSINELTTYPSILFRTDNVVPDVIKGGCLLAIFVCTFISLVWLREQIIHGGPQDFLDIARNQPVAAAGVPENVDNRDEDNNVNGFRQVEGRGRDDELPNDYHMEETDEESDTESLPGFEFQREVAVDEQEDEEESGEEDDALPRIADNEEQNGRNDDAVNGGEDNWRDWDRLGDELTWQRLLGLDGSLVFLEHVFWVISLNTLFTVIFAYLPYRLGFYTLGQLGAMEHIHYFPSVAAIITGYFMLAFFIYVIHSICGYFKWKILFRLLGIGFLVLKVFLLVLLEIGLFPIICGSWIDLCSMSMFSSTLSGRVSSFTQSPVMQVFVRWLVGMVYVFYSASFVILLREVLRPGVLWFLRNLNDPDFNPIQEMIELPVSRHIQRIVASTTLFFTTIFLVVYLPLNIIKSLIPSTLPYNVSWTADTPLSELSLELLVLQVLLPALLEQTQARVVLREAIKVWCQVVGRTLNLEGFLLPEGDAVAPPAVQQHQAQPNAEQVGGGLAAEHQALLLIREPQGAPHPYIKPSWFAMRIFALLCCMAATWTIFSTLCFLIPVNFGRIIIKTATGLQNVHDLYTTGCGLYVLWSVMRIGLFFYDWFKMETVEMQNSVKMCFSLLIRCSAIIIPSIVIIPFLLGTCFQLVFVGPLRLDNNQTGLTFLWQDWAMGVLHLKIVLAVVMMGPEWWLRAACDRIYQDGFRNLRATRIMCVVVLPVVLCLASAIAIPHLLAVLIATVTGASNIQLIVIHRLCYPVCAAITLTTSFAGWQYNKFKGLADTIRNEKYLVGTRLINYEREAKKNN